MAFLFVDSLSHKKSRLVQISLKILELLLLSTGLITTLVMVKRTAILPYSCDVVFSSLVGFWSSITCFLSSTLSICIFIHVMVVLIAVSSTLYRRETHNPDVEITRNVLQHALQIAESLPPPPPSPPWDVVQLTPPPPRAEENPGQKATLSSHEFKKAAPDSSELVKEKTKITTNYPEIWKDVSLDDKENEEEGTIEATWKAIIRGGKQRPKKKHLKKSETWDVPPRRSAAVQRLDSEELLPTTPKWKELRKAETFNDAVSVMRRGGLRRDPSMSLEEFNLQVEAFINKFNDNMRLQRQESRQRFLDMINRGF